MIFQNVPNTTRRFAARGILDNFEISLAVLLPNTTTSHAITSVYKSRSINKGQTQTNTYSLAEQFATLKKCRGKLEYLIYEMLFRRIKSPTLITQKCGSEPPASRTLLSHFPYLYLPAPALFSPAPVSYKLGDSKHILVN